MATNFAVVGRDPPAGSDGGGETPAAWVLQRFRPARQRVTLLEREGLLAELDAEGDCPLVALVGPAGFGKSTLMAQWWARLRERPDTVAAWISLAEGDSDAGELLLDVHDSIALAMGHPFPHRQGAPPPARALHDAIGRQLRTLAAEGRRLALLLDDAHLASARALRVLIDEVVARPAGEVRLVLAARQLERLNLSALEARGLLHVIGPNGLRFTGEEVAQLAGQPAGGGDPALLMAKTEGWPVAVQLATIWLGRQRDGLADFHGGSDGIARYLMEHVLAAIDPELRDFMIDTSILPAFDAGLADAVRDRGDSRALISRLAQLEALFLPVDGQREQFRYHSLLADFLRQLLAAEPPARAQALRRRAARHLATRGALVEAVEQAAAAPDMALATGLLTEAGGWEVIVRASTGHANRLIGCFDEATLRRSAALQLMKGYRLINQSDYPGARARIRAARAMIGTGDPLQRDVVLVQALLDGYADEVYSAQWHEAMREAIAAADRDDHLMQACMRNVLANGAMAVGDLGGVERLVEEAVPHWRASGIVVGEVHCQIGVAQCRFLRGDLSGAEAALAEAAANGASWEAPDALLEAIIGCLSGNLLYWRNEQTAARALVAQWIDKLEQHDAWLDIYATAYRLAATLDFIHGGTELALQTVDRAVALARTRGYAALEALALGWRLEVLVVGDEFQAADAWVAERRLTEVQRDMRMGWRPSQAIGIALVQWHLQSGRAGATLPLLEEMRGAATASGRRMDLARLDALKAAALWHRGERGRAVEALAPALQLVAAEGVMRVVMDTACPVEPLLEAAMEAGGARALRPELRAAAADIRQALRREQDDPRDGLSSRELAVLRQLALGRSNKQIAWQLSCSENTVKFHLKSLYAKLQVPSRSGAVAAGMARGLVRAD